MKKSGLKWFYAQVEQLSTRAGIHMSWVMMDNLFKDAIEIEKHEDLKRQMFIGKVSKILGMDKTVELLKECNKTFEK
jgi:hypothetical protein